MNCRGWILGGLLALLPTISQAGLMVMIDGIPGSYKFPPYSGWYPAEAASWNHDRSNVAKPFGFTVVMEQSGIGFASIAQASFNSVILKRIIVDRTKTVNSDTVIVTSRLTCEDAQLRAIGTSGSESEMPRIQLDINCGRFSWENFDVDKNGVVFSAGKGSWNFKTNTP
jgi:hypothetical protein